MGQVRLVSKEAR